MEDECCPECGVPKPINMGHSWLNNGDIVQSFSPRTRMGFIECETLDPMFKNIGDIIGVPIEQIVTNIVARGFMYSIKQMIPQGTRARIVERQADQEQINEILLALSKVMGYGKPEFVGSRYEKDDDDYATYRVTKPFSVPIFAGSIMGSLSAVLGGEHSVSFKEISPEVYEFTAKWAQYPDHLRERFEPALYYHHDGDLDLERCGTCGGPKDLGNYRWDTDEGIIANRRTGKRMALMEPESLDHLFTELEKELGETISEAVVEAQRRFTRTGFFALDDYADVEGFRNGLALKGLGNLRELDIKRSGMRMRMENSALPLMLTGIMQGVFETYLDMETSVEWELSEDDELQMEVRPR